MFIKKVNLFTVAIATILLASCGGGSDNKESSSNDISIEENKDENVNTLKESCDTIPGSQPTIEAEPKATETPEKKEDVDKTPIMPIESGHVVSVSESVFGEYEGCFEILAKKFPTEKSKRGGYSFEVEIKRTNKALPFTLSKAACVDDVFSKKKIFYGLCVEILDKSGSVIRKCEGRSKLTDHIGGVYKLFNAKSGEVCKLELGLAPVDMMFADEPAMVRISSILEDKTAEETAE